MQVRINRLEDALTFLLDQYPNKKADDYFSLDSCYKLLISHLYYFDKKTISEIKITEDSDALVYLAAFLTLHILLTNDFKKALPQLSKQYISINSILGYVQGAQNYECLLYYGHAIMKDPAFRALLQDDKYKKAVGPILALLPPSIVDVKDAKIDNPEQKPQQLLNHKQFLFQAYLQAREAQLGSNEYAGLDKDYQTKKQDLYVGTIACFFLPFAFLFVPGFSLINKAIQDKKYSRAFLIGAASFIISLIPPISSIACGLICNKRVDAARKKRDDYYPNAVIILKDFNKDEYDGNIAFRKRAKIAFAQILDMNRVNLGWQKQKKIPNEEKELNKVSFFMTPQQVRRYQLYAEAKIKYEAADKIKEPNLKKRRQERIIRELFTEINQSKAANENTSQVLEEVERVCNTVKKI